MSKHKGKAAHRPTATEAAEAARKEDPMTSYDPEADATESTGSPPAERNAPGNGSAAATDTAGPAGAQPAEEVEPGAERSQPAEAAETPEPAAAEEPEAAGPTEADQARAETAALYDRYLRLQAEFENYKRRIGKEHSDSLRYALTPLVTEVAAVLDDLERALEHARKEQGEAVTALVAGIEMVLKHLYETLNRFGVTRIEAVGRPFDPSQHEAIQVVETEDAPENQVMEEYQAGYLLHDRVIRPARVSVSKRVSDSSRQATPAGG